VLLKIGARGTPALAGGQGRAQGALARAYPPAGRRSLYGRGAGASGYAGRLDGGTGRSRSSGRLGVPSVNVRPSSVESLNCRPFKVNHEGTGQAMRIAHMLCVSILRLCVPGIAELFI